MAAEPLHVVVQFGNGVPSDIQAVALLAFEKKLRELSGLRVEVFKEQRGDDSKLRNAMTPQQRAKL